jgi:hypothetical protein
MITLLLGAFLALQTCTTEVVVQPDTAAEAMLIARNGLFGRSMAYRYRVARETAIVKQFIARTVAGEIPAAVAHELGISVLFVCVPQA